MDIKEFLKNEAMVIDKELSKLSKEWQKEVIKKTPELKDLTGFFLESLDGGKRVRGALIKLGYKLFSNRENKNLVSLAAAYELFQTSILIHDDIIDKSLLRRGQKTLYQKIDGGHYGISQAICLADAGFFLTYKWINESGFDLENKVKIIGFLSKIMLDTVMGEMLDIRSAKYKDFSLKTVLNTALLKTARYSIAGPLYLGAMLAGASEKNLKLILEYGENLGIAYQVQDDILGVFGDPKTTGKSVSSDISEGIATFLIAFALKKWSPSQKSKLTKLYGKDNLNESDAEMVRTIFSQTGGLDECLRLGLEYTVRAKKVTEKMDSDQKSVQILKELADYLLKRDK